MITVNNMLGAASGTAEMELKGLSTDTKPTKTFSGKNIGVNSVFLELDTGDLYYFTGESWEVMSMNGEGGGSGAGLPDVTSADNGKVLGVVDGAWGKVENTLYVEYDEETTDTDELLETLWDAWNAKKTVYMRMLNGEWKLTAFEYDASTDIYQAQFTIVGRIGPNVVGDLLFYLKTNEEPVLTYSMCLPAPVYGDEGKILKVVNGVWTKTDAPDNTLTYTITLTGEDTGTTSVPIADIYEAFVQNKVVVQRAEIREGSSVVYVSFVITQMMYDEGEGGRYNIWAVTGSGGDAVALFSAESTGTNSLQFQINVIGSSLAPMIVTGALSGGSLTITSHDAEEIAEAYDNGRSVFLDVPSMNARLYLESVRYTGDNDFEIGFCCSSPTGTGVELKYVQFENSLTGTVGSVILTGN